MAMQVRSDRDETAKRASGGVLSVSKANGISQHARTIVAWAALLIFGIWLGMACAQIAKAGVRWPKTEQQVMLPQPLQQLIEAAQLIEAENGKAKENHAER